MRSIGDVCGARLGRDANHFDTLRLLGACLVFYSHAFVLYGKRMPYFIAPPGGTMDISFATLGVSLFFVMSGFLVTRSWEEGNGVFGYLWRRFLRLYPGLTVCLLFLMFGLGTLASSLSAREYLGQVTGAFLPILAQGLRFDSPDLPGVFTTGFFPGMVDTPLWTLKVEVNCYLAVAAAGLLRIGLRRGWVLSAVLYFTLYWKRIIHPVEIPDLVVLHGAAFLLGAGLWLFRGLIPYDRRWFGACVAALCAISIWDLHWIPLYLPIVAYVVVYAGFSGGMGSQGGRFGDLSYGIYIYAWPVQQAFARWFRYEPEYFWTFFLASFAATVLLAFASWHLVEARALRFKGWNTPAGSKSPLRRR